jgi:hypothetical protein
LFGAVALLGCAIARSSLVPWSYASSTRKYAVRELERVDERNLLVIEGGSYAVNGIDTEVLTDELRRLGYSVRAVKLAIGAGNHFERYQLNEDVRRRYRATGPAAQRLIVLAEVHSSYDRVPLAQFDDNQDTNRVYYYLTPSNAWYAQRALRSENVETPLKDAWRWPLFRHTLINAFNAGAFNRLVPEADVELGTGRSSDKHPPYRKFRGLRPLLRELKRPVQRATPLPWLFDIRERRLLELWQPYVDDLVYFGLPSTTTAQLAYVQSFCQTTQRPCIAPADAELIKALDEKPHWRNAGHMRASGAAIYSRWLAGRLHALKVLAP